MSRLGHSAKATPAQRKEVFRLRAEGWTIRAIAEEVFGDVRFRGRVERILAPQRAGGRAEVRVPAGVDLEDVDFGALSHTELLRLLLDRTLRHWAKTGATPSMNALSTQFSLMVRLHNLEAFERLQRLTAEPEGSEPRRRRRSANHPTRR